MLTMLVLIVGCAAVSFYLLLALWVVGVWVASLCDSLAELLSPSDPVSHHGDATSGAPKRF